MIDSVKRINDTSYVVSSQSGKETNEAALLQIAIQSTKQEWNHSFSDKTTIWRAHYIKISENTEQRIIIQMHSIQHPQIDSSHYNIQMYISLNIDIQKTLADYNIVSFID